VGVALVVKIVVEMTDYVFVKFDDLPTLATPLNASASD